MPTKYEIRQKVLIKPVSEQGLSARDSDLRQYAGQIGEITNYYWIRPPTGGVFYLYNVRVGNSDREIVLYEDEIERVSDTKPKPRNLKDE